MGNEIIVTGEYGLPVVVPLDDVYGSLAGQYRARRGMALALGNSQNQLSPILVDQPRSGESRFPIFRSEISAFCCRFTLSLYSDPITHFTLTP